MKQIGFIFLLLSLVFISACSKTTPSAINPEVLVTVTPPPQPEAGKSTISGQVMHTAGYPVANTVIRLAEVARGAEGKGGAFILDVARSPGTITDVNGYFVIQNVKAGEYVIVVGDVEATGIYEIIPENETEAKVYNLPADQITNVGIITVSIIPPTAIPTITPGPYPAPTVPVNIYP